MSFGISAPSESLRRGSKLALAIGVPVIAATLRDAIREAAPQRLLVIGPGAVTIAADAYRDERAGAVVREAQDLPQLEADADGRYDLALVGDVIGVWPDVEARRLLAALRDRYSDRILILAPEAAWPLTDYLALGFERRGAPADGLALFWYDVDRFNPEREWNNPDHWANPENFKRYRW